MSDANKCDCPCHKKEYAKYQILHLAGKKCCKDGKVQTFVDSKELVKKYNIEVNHD